MLVTKIWMRYNPTLITALGLVALLAGCSRQPPVFEAPPVEVIICKPYRETVRDWDVYTGVVDAKENVEIRARVQAYIKEVKFREGDEVKTGDLLFVLDDGPFQAAKMSAQGELKSWEAKFDLAAEQIKRYDLLVKKGSASKEDLDRAVAAKGEAIGGMATARGKIQEAQVNIDYCRISSPIDGRIGQALLTKGNLANSTGAQSLLTTVVSVDPMYVYFYVNERAVLNYLERSSKNGQKYGYKIGNGNGANGMSAQIPVGMALATDQGFPHKGVVDFVNNRIDPGTGSLKVRATFNNPKGPDGYRRLTPGLFARVAVQIEDEYDAVLVTDRAILTDQNLRYVLIVNRDKDNLVERIDVDVGRLQEDGLRVIKSGLKGNEWIVVEGVNRVRPGVTATPKEGPMPRLPAKKLQQVAPKQSIEN